MEKKNNDTIFGIRAVAEAIKSGQNCDKVLVRKGLKGDLFEELNAILREHRIPVQFVPDAKLNRITRKNHQGVIALMSPVPFHDAEEVLMSVFEKGDDPFFIVLDEITDVRNFGAIVRSAECAGVHAIVIPQKGSARIGGDAVKTSAGAIFNIPICRTNALKRTVQYLKESGLKVAAASEKGDQPLFKTDLTGPVALLMGAEDTGISKSMLDMADAVTSIPILGKIESLNVANAASVMMYEIVRQRMNT